MKQHFDLLGFNVTDVVTGFTGVVTTISFDLFGCVQAIVTPGAKDQKIEDSRWFDTKRLKRLSNEPVMVAPAFDIVPGGYEKPQPPSQPLPGRA